MPNPKRMLGDQDSFGELRSAPSPPREIPWRRLFSLRRSHWIVASVVLLTSFIVTLTIRAGAQQDVYSSLRREELVQLLDNASSETRRLEAEIRELQSARDALRSGASGRESARREAQRRLNQLQILAGTVPATGPGIRLTIADPNNLVTPEVLLNGLEELRDAGAEVMEINDTVRLTVTSWVGLDDKGHLAIDGVPLTKPISIEAIGDPATLEAGARFRGGLVSEIEGPRVGGSVTIRQSDKVEIQSVTQAKSPRHARPR